MSYLFTAGSFPNLSYAELRSILETFEFSPDGVRRFTKSSFLVQSKGLTDDIVLRIFQRLGGFTRVGKVIDDLDSFLTEFSDSTKIVFGISVISESPEREDRILVEKLSKQIKKYFINEKIPCRFIFPKKFELNASTNIKKS